MTCRKTYQDALQLTNPQLAEDRARCGIDRGAPLPGLPAAGFEQSRPRRPASSAELHAYDHGSSGNGTFDYLKRKFGI